MTDIFVEATRDMINSPLGEQIIYALIIVVPILLVFYFVYQDSIIEKFSDGVLYVIIYGSVCFLLFLKYPRLKDVFIDAIFLGSFAFFLQAARKTILLFFEWFENLCNKRHRF